MYVSQVTVHLPIFLFLNSWEPLSSIKHGPDGKAEDVQDAEGEPEVKRQKTKL